MTVRTIDESTGKETSRPLTQVELDQSVIDTADEISRNAARVNPDEVLDTAIEAANTLPELKSALLGRTRGRNG